MLADVRREMLAQQLEVIFSGCRQQVRDAFAAYGFAEEGGVRFVTRLSDALELCEGGGVAESSWKMLKFRMGDLYENQLGLIE